MQHQRQINNKLIDENVNTLPPNSGRDDKPPPIIDKRLSVLQKLHFIFRYKKAPINGAFETRCNEREQ